MLPTSNTTPTTAPQDTIIVSPGGNKKSNRNLLFAGGGILLLMVGLISAVVLSANTTGFFSSAWDCQNYSFSVSQIGVVTVSNNSTRNEPIQRADVFINSAKVATYDVPAVAKGEGATLGTVTVPQGGFSWEVRGTKDCNNAGRFDSISARCLNVLVYDENWAPVTDLSTLKAGDTIRIAVSGSTSSGQFTKARFTVNGDLQPETTLTRPSSTDFYMEYTIPQATTSFSVNAELFHNTINQWI